MEHDLAEAHQRLDYCDAESADLTIKISAFFQNSFEIRFQRSFETKVLHGDFETHIQARITSPVPIEIRAKVGNIINEARSVLDHLANVLAERNGFPNSRRTYFPVSETIEKFREDGKKKIAKLRQEDQDLIVELQPMGEKRPLIYGFHEFDIIRKHIRLGVQVPALDGFGVSSPDGGNIIIDYLKPIRPAPKLGLEWNTIYRFRALTRVRLTPNVQLTFISPVQISGQSVTSALPALVREVRQIVTMFD